MEDGKLWARDGDGERGEPMVGVGGEEDICGSEEWGGGEEARWVKV